MTSPRHDKLRADLLELQQEGEGLLEQIVNASGGKA